ncbi:hypothetical protein [Persicimonas caeni]|uniref:hypothetical protein n=1 Tax=Persicimonas caeni TaxID=2292766 RepID=UPI00143CEC4F|nr:hypothetical protein [Persicimonas caeni]
MSEAIFGIEPDRVEAAVRKIKKERDGYAKMNVLEEFGVGWGERKAALWEMIRQGHYDAWNDPAIWSELAGEEGLQVASTEDLVDFLAHVEHYDEQVDASATADEPGDEDAYYDDYYEDGYDDYYDGGYEQPAYESPRLVSFWPEALDTMAMHAYAADAEVVEARAGEFAPEVQKGLQLVRRRFGKISRDELPEETAESLATTHVWKSLPWYAWDVVDGELTKLEIGRQDGHGPEAKRRFLSNFIDEEQWAQAVLDAVFMDDYAPSFHKTLEAWSIADLEQLEWLISEVSVYNADRVRAWDLVAARDDAPADLMQVAKDLAEKNRTAQAEFAAIAAVHAAIARGEDAPEEALELIAFKTLDNPTKRDGYPSLPKLIEALHAFDEDQSVQRFFEAFDSDYGKNEAFPALKAYPDNAKLRQRAFETVDVIAGGNYSSFGSMNKVAFGLAMLGPDALAPIAEAFDASDQAPARDAYRRAVMAILADADEAQDADYDRFVSLVDFEDEEGVREHDLGYYVAEDYRAALANMPQERAIARVSEDFAKDVNWHRALAALKALPHDELFDQAFGLIGRNGLPPSDDYNWVSPLLNELRDEIRPYLGPALAASDSPEFHNAIKRHLGDETYETLLAEAGGTTAADSGPADKIRRLAKAAFEAHPDETPTTIYVFERLDEEPEGDTLNRIGGRPFGVTAETWPLKNDDADSPMQHMLTLDLDTVPKLASAFNEEVRALSLYVRSPGYNEAWTAHNDDTQVVAVGRDAAGEFEGELPVGDESARGFAIHEVEVPFAAFTVPYDGDADLRRVRDAIYSTNAWGGGGGPLWLQGEEYFGNFVLQFDEGFVYMNLGDCGIMYVFADTAFWQCH